MDFIDIGIYLLFILFIVTIAGGVLMELLNLVKDPKALIRVGLAIVGFAALFFIAYAVSTGDLKSKYIAVGITENYSKLIGAGLIVFYVFLVTSFIGILVSEIYKIFK